MRRISSNWAGRLLPCCLILLVIVAGCGGASSTATPSVGTAPPPKSLGTPQVGGDAAALIAQGQAALEAGKLPEAEKAFRDAVDLDSGSPDAQFGLGNVYMRQGQLPAAETAYRAAVNISPDMSSAHLNLGVVYYQMEQLSKAEEEFAQALYLLAAVRIQSKQYAEAEKLLNQAKVIQPDLAEVYYGLGAVYKLQGKKTEAIAAFEKFLSLGTAQDPNAEDAARGELRTLQGE
jgi:tetratricopeptide (TPR) repeat protein